MKRLIEIKEIEATTDFFAELATAGVMRALTMDQEYSKQKRAAI